ncbi:helix-turn-helix domain-containing protein [Amycolatopsis benzoatilytica]|uniref:helix-turn-helix domain-containing protein n=1 Tax=Amycolatopsis benzoatilytica TaxID=346045 RepID=UPI000363E677|nr:AraC family transcriptional regulator [Amycolatopsis benzoatilytica]
MVARNPVREVVSYVQDNTSEPLTVTDMAERVSLSPSAFSHLFCEVTGKSPYQFAKEMRLNRARDLLIGGTLSVTQAHDSGRPRAYSDLRPAGIGRIAQAGLLDQCAQHIVG